MSSQLFHRADPIVLAICGGALCAGFALFPLNFSIISFIVTYFAALPIFFVGLSWGIPRLLVSALVAFTIFAIGSSLQAGAVFFLTTLLPAILIVSRFIKGDPAGYIVSWMTCFAIVLFLSIIIVLSMHSINVLEMIHEWIGFFVDEKTLKGLHGKIIPLFPGISSVTWILMNLVNASLAQRLVVRAHLTSRPYPLPTDNKLYEYWDLVLVLSLLLILTDVPLFAFIGQNLALICCVPLFFLGLKVVYSWLSQFNDPKIWLIIIVFMSILLVWPGMIIVMFGVLEPTLHLCRRWAPKEK